MAHSGGATTMGVDENNEERGGYQQINKALNIDAFEDYLQGQRARLPVLADVEQLSPRVLRILGQNPGQFTLQGTNTYIVGTGPERLLIDTAQGLRKWADLISATLAARSIRISHVLLTHWHGDHSGGVPDLRRLYPHLHSRIYANLPDKDQQDIADGQVFHAEGATIRAVHAPGHSEDHMCFVLEEESAMFTGDNILGHGSSGMAELGVYMASLSKMQAQDCTTGYPAHGAVVANLPAKITGELAQKTRREQQIVQALQQLQDTSKAGNQRRPARYSVSELVTAMFGAGVGDRVRQDALVPFIDEILRKLACDGKVAFASRAGEKRWFLVPAVAAAG